MGSDFQAQNLHPCEIAHKSRQNNFGAIRRHIPCNCGGSEKSRLREKEKN